VLDTTTVCEPALKPLTVNDPDDKVALCDEPPSTVYVIADTDGVGDKLIVDVPFDPPKQVTPVEAV
jgi:hypothetical protein